MVRRSRTMRFAGRSLGKALAVGSVAVACFSSPPDLPQWQGAGVLGATPVHVVVRHPSEWMARAAIAEALDAATAVYAPLRARGAGSEIDLLSKVPSHLWVTVSRTTYDALVLGASVAEATEGAYDYTWPPLQKPWGLRPGASPRVPRAFEIESALRRVDWEDVELRDQDGPEARRLTRRTEIDLGLLAEALALDAAVERLRALGVEAARADTARVHRMYGGTRRRPWRVETGELSLVLLEGALAEAVRGETVSAPGEPAVYAKLDPRDGTAVKARWAAVMATRAGEAACWAEALLAIGTDGAGLVGEHPIEAAIAPADGTPWISPGFDAEARD